METIVDLMHLQNKRVEIESNLKKQKIKIGDSVDYLYYKPFVGYKIKKAKVIDTDVTVYDECYSFKLKFKNGKTTLADLNEVQLINAT